MAPSYSTPLLDPEIPVEEIIPTTKPKSGFSERRKNVLLPVSQPEPATTKFGPRNGERKVLRTNPGTVTTENSIQESDNERTPWYRYGPEAYAVKKQEQTPRRRYYKENFRTESQPPPPQHEDHQYQDEEELSPQNYYARRLKRRGDAAEEEQEDVYLEREYLLEPSFRADASTGFREELKCPPPVQITVTQTKTITKFINPPPSVASVPSLAREAVTPSTGVWVPDQPRRRGGRRFQATKAQTYEPLSPSPSVFYHEVQPEAAPSPTPTRTRGRGDILYRARLSPSPSPPLPPTLEPLRAEINGDGNPGRVRQRTRSRRPSE